VVYVDHLAADPFSALPTATETTSTGPVTVSEGGFLQTLGYQVQTTWQENGITVDLLTV
jgi:hypothetical protein